MSAPQDHVLARAREAALAELRRTPVAVSWRRPAMRVAGVFVATCALAAVAALATSLAGPARFGERGPFLGALMIVGALAGVAALAPRARFLRGVVLVAAPALMATLVVSRGAGLPSTTPAWVCSVSHLGLGLVPLGVALWGLRQSAWQGSRALAAGLGAGTAGAFLGELACHRGAQHVLVHHLGAWLLVTAACVFLSRRARPRTFAP